MAQNPFEDVSDTDVSGQYAALRRAIHLLRGIEIPPAPEARAAERAAAKALGFEAGTELGCALDLLSDVIACSAFDTLLGTKGSITGEGHPYVFSLQDLSTIDASTQALSLMHTQDLENFFTVQAGDASQESAPMVVLGREDATQPNLNIEPMSGHPSLRSWLYKFFVSIDLGKSLQFTNYLENQDVDGFLATAHSLYGQPSSLGQDHLLFWSDNAIFTVIGTDEPWVDLWVLDQTQDWPQSAALLQPIELSQAALAKWRDEAASTG